MSEAMRRLAAALADRYTIERELGAGGMATVYLAEDLKHRRKVALKVLKPELAAVLGAERFVQEITTTAALQHPHILPLFDSGEADGFLFYVMPFIDGETLRDKLNRETQLGVDEAVRLTVEVADALHYAHTQGVVHRDIKPENILLANGRPMVADFGIALALSAAAGGRMTETGMSLGTPHYMSPEQATADKDISARSDVYSLASVSYEMLAGQPPHLGGSAQQIIMKIIAEPVEPVTRYRKSVPPNVAAALAKALEKLPADRFATAKEFAEALGSAGFSYASRTVGVAAAAPAAAPSRRRQALLGVAGLVLLAIGAAGWGLTHPAPPEPPTMQWDLTLGPAGIGLPSDVATSPDGSMLAFSANMPGKNEPAIFLRRLDGEPNFRMVAGTEGGSQPVFSPDNQWIVFRRATQGLGKVSVAGGGVATIANVTFANNPHWGTDDQIVFTGPPGAFIIPATGGEPKRLLGLGGRRIFLLPDGSGVLGTSANSDVVVYDLRTDSITRLDVQGMHPTYSESGHLLYVAEGGVFAVPFDLPSHRVTGNPLRVVDRVGATISLRGYAVSSNGSLVVHDAESAGGTGRHTLLVIMTRSGRADTLPLPDGRKISPALSPDGRSVAYIMSESPTGGSGNLFTYDMVSHDNTQITFEGQSLSPTWSPDSRLLLYSELGASDSVGGTATIHIKPADNSRAGAPIPRPSPFSYGTDWPREDLVLITAFPATGAGGDLYTVSPTAGTQPEPYQTAPFGEQNARLSPDGTLAVFDGRQKDTWQVWMRDFPTPVGEWLVSSGPGQHARWSRDGRHVYFWRIASIDTLMRAEVVRQPSVVVRAPEVVATMDVASTSNWDLHPDGERFIVAVAAAAAPTDDSVSDERHLITTNWFAKLRTMFAAQGK